jgi:hypothetical protein
MRLPLKAFVEFLKLLSEEFVSLGNAHNDASSSPGLIQSLHKAQCSHLVQGLHVAVEDRTKALVPGRYCYGGEAATYSHIEDGQTFT